MTVETTLLSSSEETNVIDGLELQKKVAEFAFNVINVVEMGPSNGMALKTDPNYQTNYQKFTLLFPQNKSISEEMFEKLVVKYANMKRITAAQYDSYEPKKGEIILPASDKAGFELFADELLRIMSVSAN